MKNIILIFSFLLIICLQAQNRIIPADTVVTTNHTTKIKGITVNYEAQTGTQPVWNKEGKPIVERSC